MRAGGTERHDRAASRMAHLRCAGLFAIAALATFLATPPAASAGFRDGKYVGRTSQGDRVSFKATHVRLKNLRFRMILDCESGVQVAIAATRGQDASLDEKGIITALLTGEVDPITTVFSGQVYGSRAKGTIETTAIAPSGVECSGRVGWKAKRK
jgi:hypothetical protein